MVVVPLKGMIGFTYRKDSYLSSLIRWFTRSLWSHTFIIYQSEPEVLVLEAGRFTVQIVPISKYESDKYVIAWFIPKYPSEVIERGIQEARRHIEKPYGWIQFLGFIPVILFRRLFGLKISNPARGGIVCSELVLQYLRGLEPGSRWDMMDMNTVSPEDIFTELALHEGFQLVEG